MLDRIAPDTRAPDPSDPAPRGAPADGGPVSAIPPPADVAYVGLVSVEVDATDLERGVFQVRQHLPVAGPGPLTLLYPKWVPGYHSPYNPLELFAGLEVRAGGQVLAWRRDPVEVFAFHLEVPAGVAALDIAFQFLSPTNSSQGDVVVTPEILLLQWSRMVLYPAGYYARGIEVAAEVRLPSGWAFASALPAVRAGETIRFAPAPLDRLVDSPVMAGRFMKEVPLDGAVRLALFAHDPAHIEAPAEAADAFRALVAQADRLFQARHFGGYVFLTALSDELGGGGVEHHACAEVIVPPDFLTTWDKNFPKRDVFGHEFVHSWNGKFRRGADSWIADFQGPIRNSLMWVYEGQTQYWGQVLTARAGLWTRPTALEALAKIAATYDVRPGGLWRTLADTTRDPIIAGRAPLPWPSWQRSEDYYAEGLLMWLSADTLIRERSGDTRSLDDFARAFFGVCDGRTRTLVYDQDEVIATLRGVVDLDWAGFLTDHLERRQEGAPLDGLARGGYRLVYKDHRTTFCRAFDALAGQFDLRFSAGLILSDEGTVQEVMWNGPAFRAGLTAGALVTHVDGRPYGEQVFGDAVEAATDGRPIRLSVQTRGRPRDVELRYDGGHRFPHLEPIPGARPRLDEILAPSRG